MIEDKLTQDQRLHLESVAQANALISASPFTTLTDVDPGDALVALATRIHAFLAADSVDLPAAARDIRRYGLTADQWCEVMRPGGPESMADFDVAGMASWEDRMSYPEFMTRAANCAWYDNRYVPKDAP